MTTKVKIITGFVVMVLLLGGIATIGYISTNRVANGFGEYRRFAEINVGISNALAEVNYADGCLYATVLGRETSWIDGPEGSIKALENAHKQVKTARSQSQLEEVQALLDKMDKSITSFIPQHQALLEKLLDEYKYYDESVQPHLASSMEHMKALGDYAASVGNVAATNRLSGVWSNLADVKANIGRYALSMSPEEGKSVTAGISHIDERLASLEAFLASAEEQRLMGAFKESFQKLKDSCATFALKTESLNNHINSMAQFSIDLIADGKAAEKLVEGATRSEGESISSTVSFSKTTMLIGSLAGLVIGIVLALFIVRGLVRILSNLSRFANAVSKGDFSQKIIIREGGEIGSMVAAMREIPVVLGNVIRGATELSDNILAGRFRDRLDVNSLHGEYKVLAQAVNSVGDAYTDAIDSIPVPVFSYNQNMERLFGNKIGEQDLGVSYVNEATGKFDDSFGRKAKESNNVCAGEISILAKDRRFDMQITAMPLHNIKEEIVGHIEILNDLTEVKAQQRTILGVAEQASGISERVAAASEEIAAQVEQISRGAEIQRSRVESTATAMTEMNSTVLEVASNAGQAAEQSDNTRNKAEDGSKLVSKVVESINLVAESSGAMQKNMEELGHQAESIGEVMTVISDIADQTNLLALNAAIEAARAGEAGRGFAVVADEVRKLAEKTMSATQEVASSITSIQRSTSISIEEMNKTGNRVVQATELASSSGEALHEIVELATSSSNVVASIATAAEEQSAASEEINCAIEEINRIVAETSEGIMQSSEAVQELSRMAQELRSMMDELR